MTRFRSSSLSAVVAGVMARSMADLSSAPGLQLDFELVVVDAGDPLVRSGQISGAHEWLIGRDELAQVVLVKLGENFAAIDSPYEVDALLVAVASEIQDRVMDEINTPWPVALSGDGTVLLPGFDGAGRAMWKSGEEGIVAIGSLSEITPKPSCSTKSGCGSV